MNPQEEGQRRLQRFAVDPSAIVSGSDGDQNEEEDEYSYSVEDSFSGDSNHSQSDDDHTHSERNDFMYDPNLDDEDEAWVYKHMRGGLQEHVPVIMVNRKKQEQQQQQQQQQSQQRVILPVYQPRKSDAILSCPCCFQIVCMDCQRHEVYLNQYRAMFVMNIGVAWDKTITPEHERVENDDTNTTTTTRTKKGLENQSKNMVEEDEDASKQGREIYYSVHCSSCCTEVAALNMEDEVYHFFGCLASSA